MQAAAGLSLSLIACSQNSSAHALTVALAVVLTILQSPYCLRAPAMATIFL